MSKQGVERYFAFIKDRVSTNWRDLAGHLKFTAPDINNIDTQHRTDKARCMELLQQWHTRKGNAATIQVLMKALAKAGLQLVVDNLKDNHPELNEKPKLNAKRRRPFASIVSGPEQKVRKSEGKPSPMLVAISETSHTGTSDSHTEFSEEQFHTQNPVLLDIKQKLANKDLSLEEKVKIWKLKIELRKIELDTVDKQEENKVKIQNLKATFLQPQSLLTKYDEIEAKFEEERAIVKRKYKDCLIFFLDFETKSDFEHFWGSYTSGRLADSLSRVLTTEEMQRMQHGDQLVHVVRTLVLMEDYRAWRDFFRKGLDRTTSVDNLLALPPPARHVERSSLRGLDLAVIRGEDQSCADGTDGISRLNFTVREVQTAMQTSKEKSQQQVRRLAGEHREQMRTAREQTEAMVRSLTQGITRLKETEEKAQKILLEQKEENQKLREANKSMAATIQEQMYALHTAKPKGGSQGDPGKEREKEEDLEQLQQETEVQLETMQGQVQTGRIGVDAMMKEVKMLREEKDKAEKILLEQKAEIAQLQETNKNIEARIEELLTAKQPVASGSQQEDPAQTMPDQRSIDTSTAGNTEVKQWFRGSAQLEWNDHG